LTYNLPIPLILETNQRFLHLRFLVFSPDTIILLTPNPQ